MCMLSDNHDLCVLDFINDVNARTKSKSVKKNSKRKVWKPTRKVFTNIGYTWRPTGQTFTIVGNVCPLTRITTTAEVPLRKPTALESDTPKPVVTLIGNVTISRVYYVEGLGHNLFSVGQFCDLNLEVAFHQHTCFIRNLEGVDLLTGSRGNNLVDRPTPEVIAPIAEVVSLEHDASTGSPSSTTVDQDAPSPNVAHMNNDPFFGIPIPENNYEASSSSDVIPTIVHTAALNSEHITKWTKDHPLDNIIGGLERLISTRFQLHEQALFCYYNAFLTSVEPKNDKDALTQACYIEAMQEELNEFKRGIKRTRSHLVASWITRFEDGIDFEENPCSNG
ncbi:hypothetical protein Tco_0264738 [Tanacetum coccineum]